jgi:hypothetical protein
LIDAEFGRPPVKKANYEKKTSIFFIECWPPPFSR